MKRVILFLVIVTFISAPSLSADCRGRCSDHGGLVCVNGITRCGDGTGLCQNCLNKDCNVCSNDQSIIPTTQQTISIASFNIQVFGRTKASKVEVMEILAEIIARYDIVAIQEIRDQTGTAIKDLEVTVDALRTDYSYIIGPRLGRTSS